MSPRTERDGPGPIAMAEEAVALLRGAPVALLLRYYVATLPFVFGLLHFAADAARGLLDPARLAARSLAVALLFLWMKAGQSVFAAGLAARLRGAPAPRWRVRRILRLLRRQLATQPWGLFLLPLALASLVLFVPAYGFFQNCTALDDGAEGSASALWRRAARGAGRAPRQALGGVWLLSPWPAGAALALAFGLPWLLTAWEGAGPEAGAFRSTLSLVALIVAWPLSPLGLVVAANGAIALVLLPRLALLLTDRAAPFVLGFDQVTMSPAFAMAVFAVVYLAMDPAVKAFAVLRGFHAEVRRTGTDLAVALADCRAARRRTAALVLLLLGAAAAAPRAAAGAAATAPVETEALDRAIDEVLARPAYRWRLPREEPAPRTGLLGGFFQETAGFLERVARRVGNAVRRVARWLDRRFARRGPPIWPGGRSRTGPDVAFGVLLAGLALAAVVAFLLLRRRRRRAPPAEAVPLPAAAVDVARASASALPGEEWLRLAAELAARGEARLALRALFLAGLAFLADAELVRLRPYKTNRDYLRDLRRRAHVFPDVVTAFEENLAVFDRTWYGEHTPAPEALDRFSLNLEEIRRHAGA